MLAMVASTTLAVISSLLLIDNPAARKEYENVMPERIKLSVLTLFHSGITY